MTEVLEQQDTVITDPFDGNNTPIVPHETTGNEIINSAIKPEDKKEEPIETFIEDGRNFLKEKLGFEDWDSAKAEIEVLKNKVAPANEINYKNEQSKQVHLALQDGNLEGVFEALNKIVKLTKLTTGEINPSNAAEIVKLSMQSKGLSQDEVEYSFNKKYGIPQEPVQAYEDTDEEFEAKKVEWKKKIDDTNMELRIEAKSFLPDLKKIKEESELQLPQIAQTKTVKEPTPEELVMEQKNRETFLQNADDAIKAFTGFNVSYKDKDVEVQSTYSLSDDEKASVMGKMQILAEKNYNSNALFSERWVNADNSFNFNQIAKDLATLESQDKVSQKFVSDATAKAKIQFMKGKHNIDLNGNSNGQMQLDEKNTQQKNEDAVWGIG